MPYWPFSFLKKNLLYSILVRSWARLFGGSWCLKLVSNREERREEEVLLSGLELLQNWRKTVRVLTRHLQGPAYCSDTWTHLIFVVSLPTGTGTLAPCP